MPSAIHQALVGLFNERPELLANVLAPVPGMVWPPRIRVCTASAAFTDLTPPAYHADLVLRVESRRGRLLHVLVGEVQLRRDRRKRITWPVYVTSARAQAGAACPVTLVVVALTPALARWCAQPIELDTRGSVIHPLVLGPEIIPRIVDIEAACARPELAVLSAVAHARTGDGPRIATAALVACAALDSEHASLYADLVLANLDTVAREAVEKLMNLQGYRPMSPTFRRHFDAGRKEGLKAGQKEGQKEGRREGLAHLLAMQLEDRFGPLPEHAVQALATARTNSLLAWGRRVLAAESLDDVFAPRSKRGTRPRSATAGGTPPRSAAAPSTGPRSAAASSTGPRSATRGTRPRAAAPSTRPRSATARGTRPRSAAAPSTRPRSARRSRSR
jgi:hypothetical protein